MREELLNVLIIAGLWFGSVFFAASAFLDQPWPYRLALLSLIGSLAVYAAIGRHKDDDRSAGLALAVLVGLPVAIILAGIIWHLMSALGLWTTIE